METDDALAGLSERLSELSELYGTHSVGERPTTSEVIMHLDMRELIGICLGLSAAIKAMAQPVIIQNNK